jgi:hypothetical protein
MRTPRVIATFAYIFLVLAGVLLLMWDVLHQALHLL